MSILGVFTLQIRLFKQRPWFLALCVFLSAIVIIVANSSGPLSYDQTQIKYKSYNLVSFYAVNNQKVFNELSTLMKYRALHNLYNTFYYNFSSLDDIPAGLIQPVLKGGIAGVAILQKDGYLDVTLVGDTAEPRQIFRCLQIFSKFRTLSEVSVPLKIENDLKTKFYYLANIIAIFPVLIVHIITGLYSDFIVEDREKKLKDGFFLAGLGIHSYYIGNVLAFILVSSIPGVISFFGLVSINFKFSRMVFLVFSYGILTIVVLLTKSILVALIPLKQRQLRSAISTILMLVIPIIFAILESEVTGFQEVFSYPTIQGFPTVFQLLGYMVLHGFVLALILLTIDSKIISRLTVKKTRIRSSDEISNSGIKNYENVVKSSRVVLSVHSISKKFPNSTSRPKALDDVSFKVFENEIFALIGHNGSGKSTLLSIIVGIQKPTEGYFTLNSPTIGFCPQNDILYDLLTVREHLLFMARIRKIAPSNIASAIIKIVKELSLKDILNKKCKVLSGGEKRKACIAMAFLGDPSLVILDEPTAGMDPQSRKKLWKFIAAKKISSSIILCTHYMDEADLLADRKAFLSEGVIKCMGTSAYFKRIFKCGYTLTFKGIIDSEKISNLLNRYNLSFSINRINPHDCTTEITINNESISDFLVDMESRLPEFG